jgi:hypothetical protein
MIPPEPTNGDCEDLPPPAVGKSEFDVDIRKARDAKREERCFLGQLGSGKKSKKPKHLALCFASNGVSLIVARISCS